MITYDVAMLADLTQKVVGAAREAGRFMQQERQGFDRSRIEEKGLHDYVSYVDRETERLLVASLSALLPGSGFITEEATASHANEPCLWIVDPLDGTTNYLHNQSPYAVSIALYGRGAGLLLGVVYELCRDECFYAWKGGGAYLNGTSISASPADAIGSAYVHLGLPYDAERFGALMASLLSRFYGHVGAVRIAGSAAMDICGVAAGRCEAYIEPSLHVWDVAAAILILQEAGGVVTDFGATAWFDGAAGMEAPRVDGYDVVATTSRLQADVLSFVNDCL